MLCIYPSVRCDFDSTGGCTRNTCIYSPQIKVESFTTRVYRLDSAQANVRDAIELALEYIRSHQGKHHSVPNFIEWLQSKT